MPTFDLFLPPRSYSTWRASYPTAPGWLATAFPLLASWIDRACQRRALGGLDDRMLRDIGVTRVEAARESAKPFWR